MKNVNKPYAILLKVVLMDLLISIVSSSVSFAKTDGILTKNIMIGKYLQYDLTALNKDEAHEAICLLSPLFDEYRDNRVHVFHDDKTDYVEAKAINIPALKEAIFNTQANLDTYSVAAPSNTVVTTPSKIKIPAIANDGNVIAGTTVITAPITEQLTVSSVSTINITKNIGETYTLPTKVTATLSDATTKDLAVTWDKIANTKAIGQFTFIGILTMDKGLSNSKKIAVSAELTIQTGVLIDTTVIIFSDKNLEQVIRAIIKKPTGDIFKSDVDKITTLDAHNKKLIDLSGIENLTNLTSLYLEDNQISDIKPLQGLTNLTELCLENNQIKDSDIQSLQRALLNCGIVK